jgi:hypothetical protein
MIKHELFPTLVGEWNYDDASKFKQTFYDNALKHFTDGYSMETTGNVNLHLDPAFSPLFNNIASCAKEYLKTLGHNPDAYRFNIIKTWLNVTKEFHTPVHNHADAHLSFVYYVNAPESMTKPINFVNHDKPNCLFHGMTNAQDDILELTPYNSDVWFFVPEEGKTFMFPGKLYHFTNGHGNGQPDDPVNSIDDLKKYRIAIAGDILLTYRERVGRAYGIMPVENWKTYE